MSICLRFVSYVITCLCLLTIAKADGVTFSTGNNPQPDQQNVLLNNGAIGNTVSGLTNQTDLQVSFGSTTDVLVIPSGGQARVEASDGILNNVTISVPGGVFRSLIVNPFFGSGTATVDVTTANNEIFSFSYDLGNGQNFLTIFGAQGTSFSSVTINAPGGFTDLRQPRIAGIAGIPGVTGVGEIPEPASLFLLGVGLVGIAKRMRRRSRE